MIVDTHIHLYDPFREGGTPWPEADDKTLSQTTSPGTPSTKPPLTALPVTVSMIWRR